MSRGQLALYRSLVDAVGTLAGNVGELVVELYTAETGARYHELVQGIADIALTIVDAVPPSSECPQELVVITTLLHAACMRLRRHAVNTIKEVQKIVKTGCKIVALSNGARSLCDTCKHIQGLATLITTSEVPVALQEFLELMVSIRDVVEAVFISGGKHSDRAQKRLSNLQELAVTSFGDLPAFKLRDEEAPVSKQDFSHKQGEIHQYIALLLRQMDGKKSSSFVMELTKNTREIFSNEWLDCCLYGTRRCLSYSLAIEPAQIGVTDAADEAPVAVEESRAEKKRPPRKTRIRDSSPSVREGRRRPATNSTGQAAPLRKRSPSLNSVSFDTIPESAHEGKPQLSKKKQELPVPERTESLPQDSPTMRRLSVEDEKAARSPKKRRSSSRSRRSTGHSDAIVSPMVSKKTVSDRPAERAVPSRGERLGQRSLNPAELQTLTRSLAEIVPQKTKKKKKKLKLGLRASKSSEQEAEKKADDNESNLSVEQRVSVDELIGDVLKTVEEPEQDKEALEKSEGLKKRLTQSMRMPSKMGIQAPKKLRDFSSRIASPLSESNGKPTISVHFSDAGKSSEAATIVAAVVDVFKAELPWFAENWINDLSADCESSDDIIFSSASNGVSVPRRSTSATSREDSANSSPDFSLVGSEGSASSVPMELSEASDSAAAAVNVRIASAPIPPSFKEEFQVTRANSVPLAPSSLVLRRELQANAVRLLKARIAKELTTISTASPRPTPLHRTVSMEHENGQELRTLAESMISSGGWTRNSRSASNILGPLEVPRLRQVAKPLAAAADNFVGNLFKLVEEDLDPTELENSCVEFYTHLSRVAHLCAEGPGKQEAMRFLDGATLRERITSAAVSGVVDDRLKKLSQDSNHSRLLHGQLRAALYRQVSNFRGLVVQCCSTIDSIEPKAKQLSSGIVLQIVTHVINFLDAMNSLLDLATSTCFLRDMDFIMEAKATFSPRSSNANLSETNVWLERALPAKVLEKYPDFQLGTVNSLVNALTSYTKLGTPASLRRLS